MSKRIVRALYAKFARFGKRHSEGLVCAGAVSGDNGGRKEVTLKQKEKGKEEGRRKNSVALQQVAE
jgi:hypothetical protein